MGDVWIAAKDRTAQIETNLQAGSGTISVLDNSPDRLVVKVAAEGPTLLVVRDRLMRTARAFLNGAPAALLPANYLFMAVAVLAGLRNIDHKAVELQYTPLLGPIAPAAYHAVEAGVSSRQKTLHSYHGFNFNGPEELPRDLSEKLLAVYEPLLVFQNSLTQQAATFTNDSQGRRARPQLIQYPRGGGMFGRHLHTLEPQRISLILGLSQRGVDFQSGGTHFDVKGTDVSSEDVHDIGDMLLFRFDIPHWITPVDMSQPCDFSLASGRWTAVLPYR